MWELHVFQVHKMNSVTINTISLNPDYQIYICDVYGNNCVFNSLIPLNVPPAITLTLPIVYSNSAAVGIKIINNGNCEKFEVINCDTLIPTKTITPTVTPTQTNTPTVNNPTSTPTPTATPTATIAPVICFSLQNQLSSNSFYKCNQSPSGFLNGKPYYFIRLSDCTTSTNSVVFWDNVTSRWLHIDSTSGGIYSYNLNPDYTPVSNLTYPWIINTIISISFRIISSSGGLCPTPTPTPTQTPTKTSNLSTLQNTVSGRISCFSGQIVLDSTVPFNYYVSSSSNFCTSCSVQIFSNSSLTTPINVVTNFVVNTNQIWICNTSGVATYYTTINDGC